MTLPDWKTLVLARYCGEFPPHRETDPAQAICKNSEDIAFDLAGMGDFTPDEVSIYMAVSGYRIEFDDGKPVWLLQPPDADKAIAE